MTTTDHAKPVASHTPEPWRITGNSIKMTDHGKLYTVASVRNKLFTDEANKANARRIVAAVNACQGLSTEALEQGVVRELRYALDALLTAAADLDAAIDGVTDQFDDERARLDAVFRNARAALAAGTELNLHELLASRGKIALVWSVEDVQEVRPDLTEEQAREVLNQVERQHDATIGVTWDALELAALDLFGPAPETAVEEE